MKKSIMKEGKEQTKKEKMKTQKKKEEKIKKKMNLGMDFRKKKNSKDSREWSRNQ